MVIVVRGSVVVVVLFRLVGLWLMMCLFINWYLVLLLVWLIVFV